MRVLKQETIGLETAQLEIKQIGMRKTKTAQKGSTQNCTNPIEEQIALCYYFIKLFTRMNGLFLIFVFCRRYYISAYSSMGAYFHGALSRSAEKDAV